MKEKRRVLFLLNSFAIGGITTSLCALLSALSTEDLDVDVFARCRKGYYLDRLPNCHVLPENLWLSHMIYDKSAFQKIASVLLLVIRKLVEKIGINLYPIYCRLGGHCLNTEKYTAVIGYDETLVNYLSCIPARKRISWIHCDYRRCVDTEKVCDYLRKMDVIVCVSNYVNDVLTESNPHLAGKTVSIHNAIDRNNLMMKSKEHISDVSFTEDTFFIISCGRLDSVKQFALIPGIAQAVGQKTDRLFKWLIVGGGGENEYSMIQRQIEAHGVGDIVVCLGMKENPYPYMAKADLLVCTSLSESFPMVVNEAKALETYVVSNDFPSVHESIRNSKEGIICSIDEMPDEIAHLIEKGKNVILPEHTTDDNEAIRRSFIKLLE